MASMSAAPNFAQTRPTSSLLSGVCNCAGGLGGGGAAGFGGVAPGAAAAGLAGGVAAGVLAGLSPAGTGEGFCSLGSSAIDPVQSGLRSIFFATGTQRSARADRIERRP